MQDYGYLVDEVAGQTHALVNELLFEVEEGGDERSKSGGLFSLRGYVQSHGKVPFVRPFAHGESGEGAAIVVLGDATSSNGGIPHEDSVACGSAVGDKAFNNPGYPMYHMRRAFMLMLLACAQTNTPLALGLNANHLYFKHRDDVPEGYEIPGDDLVFWLKSFATPPDTEGTKALIAGMYGYGGCESVSKGLRTAQRALAQRVEARKIIVFIHDGQPTDERPSEVKETIDGLRKEGLAIIGVFMGPGVGAPVVRQMFGDEFSIIVPTFSDLPRRLGLILQSLE
jgi:hypothetical protein